MPFPHTLRHGVPPHGRQGRAVRHHGGPDGALWLTLVHRGGVARLTLDGVYEEYTLDAPDCRPTVIVPGPDGALWFTRFQDHRIGRVTVGGEVTSFPLPSAGGGRTASRRGRTARCGSRRRRVTASAGSPSTGRSRSSRSRSRAASSSITTGPDDALWFTLNGANAIGRITVDGGTVVHPLPTDAAGPVGVAADGDAVWFTEILVGQIGRITPDGRITELPLPDRSAKPHAIVAADDGECWFTEWGTGRVGRVTGTGEITEHALPDPSSNPTASRWARTAPCGRPWRRAGWRGWSNGCREGEAGLTYAPSTPRSADCHRPSAAPGS